MYQQCGKHYRHQMERVQYLADIYQLSKYSIKVSYNISTTLRFDYQLIDIQHVCCLMFILHFFGEAYFILATTKLAACGVQPRMKMSQPNS